jgi:hypothetical protein
MRLLNDKWEYTEVNQYTNGTDANKLGEVTDESIKQMLVFLLKEDEKFEKMIKETKRQIGLIAKVSNSDFEVKEVETIESPYCRNEVRLKVKLANETDYWFSFLYNPKSQKFEYGYLISRHSSYNLKGIMDDNFKSKILSYPNFEDIVLSKTS